MGYNNFRYARRIDADTLGIYHDDLTQLLTLDKTVANSTQMIGSNVAGHQLVIKPASNAYPSILLKGGLEMYLSYIAGNKLAIRKNAVTVATIHDGGDTLGGVLSLKETTTPGATADFGAIYTKADNELYFQTGAGVEKTITSV